jgi:hypothetical protein
VLPPLKGWELGPTTNNTRPSLVNNRRDQIYQIIPPPATQEATRTPGG